MSESVNFTSIDVIREQLSKYRYIAVEQTPGCIFKYREDIQRFKSSIWTSPEKRDQLITAYSDQNAG
jgi:hypothetical protein